MDGGYLLDSANARETYWSMHRVGAAHRLSRGAGVKVGVIDWLFGGDTHGALYAGRADIAGRPDCMTAAGHGLWMARTLREIAPDCAIYALNAVSYPEEDARAALLEQAVDWAAANGLDVLTYSHPAFTGGARARADAAVERAASAGIVTAFLHNDGAANLFPWGCVSFGGGDAAGFARTPDVRVWHFDYSVLLPEVYARYEAKRRAGAPIQSGNDLPYFSFSSMAAVLGGFAALMKARRRELDGGACRRILTETGYAWAGADTGRWYDGEACAPVADIAAALAAII